MSVISHLSGRVRAAPATDLLAGLLLVLGLLLPWNVYFGVGISGTSGWIYALLVVVTLTSLASLIVGHTDLPVARVPDALARLRIVANIPYLSTVALFVGFTVVQSIRHGGSGMTPPGIGPGAWLGLAGALLAAGVGRTSTDSGHVGTGRAWTRRIGIASVALAVWAVLFNLYWRLRFVLPGIADPDVSRQQLVTAVAAVVYAIVAVAPVILVGRWMISGSPQAQGVLSLLGAATLLSGALVWLLPVGRDIDAFHGIAQNTSTAGVGFEGYLAWAAAVALAGCGWDAMRATSPGWRLTARGCLALTALWCAGTAVLRVVDIASAAVLRLPAPPYNSAAVMAFDLVVAVLAAWLLFNGFGGALSPRLLAPLLGILFVFTVARLVIGVALVPRVKPLDPRTINPEYGNDLYQQITSTFDLTLCLVTFAIFVATLAASRPAQGHDRVGR